MSHKCNKYIIEEGEYIRDFEGMYKKFDDPWNQRANDKSDLSTYIAINVLKFIIKSHKVNVNKVLDIGCADGYHGQKLIDIEKDRDIRYLGTDISKTVINRAIDLNESDKCKFLTDDIRICNNSLIEGFDLIFTSKILYYVAPEIDKVINNINKYLSRKGFLCFVYNERKDSFSKKWLTAKGLRHKILLLGFIECTLIELNRFMDEKILIGIYQKK